MSATQVPFRPVARGTRIRLFVGLILLVIGGAALAWIGAGQMRGQVTATGVQIRTIKAGEGPLITANDGVIIDYKGALPDGTEFDAAQDAPLLVGQVVPGFAEALQNMRPGGSYKVRIPAELAYGANPPEGSPIPPNSPLDFDIAIKRVVPNAAQMVAQQQQMQQMQGQLPPGVDPGSLPPGQ